MISFSGQDEVDFDLSHEEVKEAQLRALKQAQEDIEMSQSLISDFLTLSGSNITQS